MRSKLFKEKPKTAKISTGRWVRVLPDAGDGYHLYDALVEAYLGRILFDSDNNWIYDGAVLSVKEQEDLAGVITGYQREMNELIKGL
jgi:hypothetical protein